MSGRQRILPVRRAYNRWVADETLEDFALRFTAKSARRWSAPRVSQTAIGAISFLALEAIGGAVTLSFGFVNVVWATLVVSVVLFLTGLPISRSAARAGVDIDLLTRGAGFGYIGSTVTSLVYATFTFILFAIEASIMAGALKLVFGLPLAWGYLLSAVAVIPLVTYGIAWISRFQILTQPLWIVLNVLPIGFIAAESWPSVVAWTHFPGLGGGADGFDLLRFGGAASVILALMPQIGEQVDVLRFLPARPAGRAWRWSASLVAAGPGWVILGAPKLLFGSLLATLCLRAGVPAEHAAEPAEMYRLAFAAVLPWPTGVALLTAAFVVVSQLKINVMNAYAGSLAWSNFFSRLTHSHPGRVVWLVFNVAVALLLMELGIYAALERILSLFAVVAVAWLGAVVADLAVNKPLGLSPPGIEFKRAHLYDINPVGTGAMALATAVALAAAAGWFGAPASALAPFIALAVALVTAPLIAAGTRGRFYLARKPRAAWQKHATLVCRICDNPFEPEDMAYCPAYAAPICSLCCSLDARCHDLCKPQARAAPQIAAALSAVLPARWAVQADSPTMRYLGVFVPLVAVIGLALLVIHVHAASQQGSLIRGVVDQTLWGAFAVLVILSGVLAWFFVLAAQSRRVAQEETARQTTLLLQEIAAHKRTDAALQRAKDVAEAANLAKSRYVVGLSHELRTPLNAVLGYAQLLERDGNAPTVRQNGVRVIRRSAEHLSGLIDGLLDVSKIEAGRLQIQRNEVRTAEFFTGLADMFRLQAAAKGLDFRLDLHPALPAVVRTDEKRLRQILINLLGNAVKFTTAGHVGLTVTYRNQVAVLSVADSGPGIADDNLERIFEPFDRGALSGNEAIPGLGLGLTITKLLTELMGGALTVRSAPGEGSRFEARLMLAAVATPQARVARNLQGYAGPRRTLLVVDDDGDHQALMRALLEPLGFSVLSARDGPTALAMTADLSPDLVLLDISMPGMTGWEVAEALRTLRGVTAPIAMLSANVGDGAPLPPAEGRVHDALLAKPFALSTLLDTLERLLDLTWIEASESAADPGAAVRGAPARLAPDLLADLRHLGSIGHVRGIESRLEALDRDPALAALATALRDRLRAFDFPGYQAVLAEAAPMSAPTAGAERPTVLVVDDTPDTLGLLTDALEGAGYTALVATGGPQALALVERIVPDLILLDAMMPVMDGFETCRQLRAGLAAAVPVIFMTALSDTSHIVRGLGAGGVDYLTKPIVLDELFARVRVHLANARAARGALAALDATGSALLAIDRSGTILWATPQARALLPGTGAALSAEAVKALSGAAAAPGGGALLASTDDVPPLTARFVGPVGPGESLFRLERPDTRRHDEVLAARFALTAREAEVLLWIARGKTNRDIAEILRLSPRTVNKHLETVFAKLGVENRASAAVLAARALDER